MVKDRGSREVRYPQALRQTGVFERGFSIGATGAIFSIDYGSC